MSFPVEEACERFEARAAALEALVDEETDKQISSALQTAYGSLKAAEELIIELEDQSHTLLEEKLAATKKSPSALRTINTLQSMKIMVERFPMLLESGVLLSRGKDVEAIKHISQEALKTAVAAGILLFGGKLIKDTAELVETLNELAKTGQSFKFRKRQVKAASQLKKWSQAITTGGIAWSYAVQRYLLDIAGKTYATEDDVLDLVSKRIVKCSRQWRPR